MAVHILPSNADGRFSILKLWLSRSREHAVSLFVYISAVRASLLDDFMQTLASHLHNVKRLNLNLPYRSHSPLLTVLSRDAPALESLEVRFSLPGLEQRQGSCVKTLHITSTSAPKLRLLAWGTHGPFRVTFNPDLTLLTTLDVAYCLSIPECLQILSQCRKLVSCQFQNIEQGLDTPGSPVSSEIILLPDLHTLDVQTMQPIASLLQALVLPALQTLKICNPSAEANPTLVWSQPHFNALVARSGCSINTLHLLNVLSAEDELIECLQISSSSLVELRLRDFKKRSVLTDRVLQRLTARGSTAGRFECLCPKLEVIRFGKTLLSTDGVYLWFSRILKNRQQLGIYRSDSGFLSGVLADMVESRWTFPTASTDCAAGSLCPVARLKSINPLIDSEGHHLQDIARLSELKREGLELL